MTVYRYPLNPPVTGSTAVENPTQMVDYVMFQRKRINYDDGNGTNYYGLNVPNNKVAVENNKARIYIAMPQNLQTAYQPTYRKVDMGVMGMAMAEGLSSSDLDGVVTALQTAASSALPEFATGALAQVAQGAAQMLGLAGNADANALQALTQGKVFNPYSEQLFSNMQFRTHNFSFKMFARSERESQEINNIIKYLKQGSLPIYGDSDEGKPARFFEVPDKFDIKFVRLSPDGKTLSDSEDLHYKIHTSVCTGIDVNYTPDGQYNAIKNNNLGTGDDKPLQVPVVNINCRFTETQLVTQQQIKEGF
ncbi:baseplate tail tube cap [Synechococcus phage S-CAM22]|uniref:Baseplate tail tube cap n=2 Tax=Synechococcus phage S-CAM22 TaxID=1883365 RepID=A0A1D8KQT8_9CAUD|nr:baseplate tail tube cap [Synechococcus phage S-CAM22]AOV60839.1 baseplate tail tube cap [Synechococcus phage S-CAM22]AOV61053.1 baseplate tail tube cap [Synechococcus phage S-CAM22]